MHLNRIRKAISWHAFDFNGTDPYLTMHASGVFPAKTAMSVAVTSNKPPSSMLWIAPSRNLFGPPYGSKSITVNLLSSAVEEYINDIASCWFGVTIFSTSLILAFLLIISTASDIKSLATIFPMPGISFAYRMLRRPVAASASRTRIFFSPSAGSLFLTFFCCFDSNSPLNISKNVLITQIDMSRLNWKV